MGASFLVHLRRAVPLLLLGAFLLLPAAAQPGAAAPITGYRSAADWAGTLIESGPFAKTTVLAQTPDGPVQLITVGTGDADLKPAIAILGSANAELPCGAELALRLARRLADAAAAGGDGQALLERVTFYIIPVPSPGSLQGFYARPLGLSTVNSRPLDDDRDGDIDEDGWEDLNGDGVITLLRVADGTGDYRTHPADSRVMIPAEPGRNERGGWKLYTEGTDNDGDSRYNEDPPGGVDFDRNFPYRYPYFTPGAGPHQVCEPETRAVADFFYDHPNIAVVFSYSEGDNLLRPWRSGPDSGPGPHQGSIMGGDEQYFGYLAEQYRKQIGPAGLNPDLAETARSDGSFSEWAYFHFGRFSLAALPWWPVAPEKQPAEGQTPPAPVEDVGGRGRAELNALGWFESQGIDGFVPWTPVTDPDFPGRQVEVGGFKPYLRRNPPAEKLDELAGLHCEFIKEVAGLLPRLEVASTAVEPLGEGVWRVSLTVANMGFLPTMTAMAEAARVANPLQYTLELPRGAELIGAAPRGRVERLAGNGGSAELSWIVRGTGRLEVTIASPETGSVNATIDLAGARTEKAE